MEHSQHEGDEQEKETDIFHVLERLTTVINEKNKRC